MYFIYITSTTFMNKEDFSAIKQRNANDSPENLLTTNSFASKEMFSLNNPFSTTNVTAKIPSSDVTKKVLSRESQKYYACEDKIDIDGLWRNLSRRHWPELLDLYGVNVMDR